MDIHAEEKEDDMLELLKAPEFWPVTALAMLFALITSGLKAGPRKPYQKHHHERGNPNDPDHYEN